MKNSYRFTKHLVRRMDARRIRAQAVTAALEFGRAVHTRGASVRVIGRKEVEKWRRHGIDLSDCEGVQVVCSPDGAVLTTYRNRDLRPLRPRPRRCRPAHQVTHTLLSQPLGYNETRSQLRAKEVI
jgi:hypothetical protein